MAEKVAFTFSSDGSEVFREAPFVYSPNLMVSIADLVHKHERYSKLVIEILIPTNLLGSAGPGLTWHDGVIPATELWLKIGGDKGQGSFKLNLQLVNTNRPNSMKNTDVISVFKAGDSISNLFTALGMYREQVKEALGMQFK